jgi:hypothetical protein
MLGLQKFWLVSLIVVGVWVLPAFASAATRTIADGGGNYNSTDTWVEGAVPTSADDVVATATSGPLTVNVASAAKSVNFTSYTNTLTMNAVLTVSGNVTLVEEMTVEGSSGLTVNATATLTSNTKVWPNALLLSANDITYTLADNWTISGTLTIGGNTGTTTVNGFTIYVGGGLTHGAGGGSNNFANGTTNIVLNGTGTWSNPGLSVLINNLTINTSGIITISGAMRYRTGIFTYIAGTVITTNSTMDFGSPGSNLPAGITTWNNLILSGNNTAYTIPAGYTINGNLSLTGQNTTYTLQSDLQINSLQLASTGTSTVNGFTIYVAGNLTNGTAGGNGVTLGTTNIVLNGTGTWSDPQAGGSLRNNLTINTAGTITISGNIYYDTGTLTYTAGTVVTTGSTLNIRASTTLNTNGIEWNNVTFPNGSTQTVSSDLHVNGTLTQGTASITGAGGLALGTGSTWTGSGTTSLGGGLTLGSSMTRTYTGAVTFTSTSGTKNITSNDIALASNLTFNGVGGTWELQDARQPDSHQRYSRC